jgi:hypothetical protein
MRLLVSGSTVSMHRFAAIPAWRPYLGHLIVPRARNNVAAITATGLPLACDNGAFSGFDHDLFCRMVRDFLREAEWVVVPDFVGSAHGTAALFHWYTERLPTIAGFDLADMDESAFPMAFVAQDGMDDCDAAWDCGFVRCLFIGGTTDFKLSKAAAELAAHAKSLGWAVHMGRVNSLKRIEYAFGIGCDSVDGGSYSRFANTYVPGAVRLLMQLAGDPAAAEIQVPRRVRPARKRVASLVA